MEQHHRYRVAHDVVHLAHYARPLLVGGGNRLGLSAANVLLLLQLPRRQPPPTGRLGCTPRPGEHPTGNNNGWYDRVGIRRGDQPVTDGSGNAEYQTHDRPRWVRISAHRVGLKKVGVRVHAGRERKGDHRNHGGAAHEVRGERVGASEGEGSADDGGERDGDGAAALDHSLGHQDDGGQGCDDDIPEARNPAHPGQGTPRR